MGIACGQYAKFLYDDWSSGLNPVTNVTPLCEEQAKYIAGLVSSMLSQGHSEVEPTADAISDWTERCKVSSDARCGCAATIGIRRALKPIKG